MRTPHPHQHACIENVRASLRSGKKRPLVMMPTGGGKTLTAAWIIQAALDKGSKVIFLVPAISLVDQTVREFWAEGIRDVGVIQADHPMTDPTKPVQIASVQTLMRRQLPDADLVIVDEAHQNFRFVREWMTKPGWEKVPFIGLSATPWSRGLGKSYDDLIVAATTRELIDKGFLSPFKVFAPTKPDLSKVRTRAGEFVDADASEAMQEGTLTADIVSTWLERGENRPTLCFAVDRAHAAALQRQFEAAEVPTGYIDANTSPDDREAVRKAFASGAIKVVCNVGVLTTGVDWDVRCIILARPTKSEILYTQIIGRGLRTAPGKDHCIILDHSDTTMRLGFVTDISCERLDTGRPKDSVTRDKPKPQPKECPTCHFIRPPKVHACPSCGFAPERQDAVAVVDGNLVEMSSRKLAKANREAGWPEKVDFIRSLRAYARDHGYSEKWVSHKYREKWSVWPNDHRLRSAQPAFRVQPAVAAWIRARNIAWVMSQKRGAA